jgi:FKBP-type peptidyl-prolyl cis-trans isomerase
MSNARLRRALLGLALPLFLPLAACAAEAPPAAAPAALASEDDKTFYALGLALASNVRPFGLTEAELAAVQAGLADGVLGHTPQVSLQEYGPKLQQLAQGRAAAAAEVERTAEEAFLAQMAAEPGAERAASGLLYTELAAGSGASPTAADRVRVSYHGTLRGGRVFDSSRDRGEPVEFALGQVIPCWQEGVQRMKVGGKAKLVCPAGLAYGERGAPPAIPGNAPLVFEVELLAVNPPTAAS